jgi:ribonuclease D
MVSELPPPVVVTDARGLERLLEDLERQREIAVDTEADSFFNFREKVCLVQVTVEDRDYLVDPLSGLDLRPLGRVLADPSKTKVFHDGEYDILTLKRDYGFEFRTLFDTRVAEAALGVESPGLASVLRARFGVELDKSMQRSNWSARPLTEKQIRYARLDTRYLLPLMRAQRVELESRGRTMIVEGECARLELLVPSGPSFSPDDFVKLPGVRTLDLLAQRRLRELFVLRQSLAEESDLPLFKVIGNDALVEVARRAPRTLDELARVPGFSYKQARKMGGRVLDALARAEELGPLERTPMPSSRDGAGRLEELEYELHERLKQWRKERAIELALDSSLVLNRHVLLRLALAKPRTPAELRAVEGLLEWQVSMFGEQILAVVERGLAEIPALISGSAKARRFRSRRERRDGGR